jgi:hypothetical protein
LSEQSIVDRFADLGTVPFPAGRRGPNETSAQLKNEIEKWSRVIRQAGLKAK